MARSGRRRNPPRPTDAKARIVRAGKIDATDLEVARLIGVTAGPSVAPQERREATAVEARQRAQVAAERAENAAIFPGIVDRGRAVAEIIAAGRDVKVATAVIADRASSMGGRAGMVVREVTADEAGRIVVPTTVLTSR